MGIEAHILAVGKYSKEIVDCLEYEENDYTEMRLGEPVVTTLFHCSTTFLSKELADCFPGLDWRRPKTHWLAHAPTADLESMHKLFDNRWDSNKDVEAFERLRHAGFRFFYRAL